MALGAEDSGMAMGDMGGDELPEAESPAAAPLPLDDFGHAISEAFPDNDWTPEKLSAMKEAIKICTETDEAGGYAGKKPREGLGLLEVFGKPGAKKG